MGRGTLKSLSESEYEELSSFWDVLLQDIGDDTTIRTWSLSDGKSDYFNDLIKSSASFMSKLNCVRSRIIMSAPLTYLIKVLGFLTESNNLID